MWLTGLAIAAIIFCCFGMMIAAGTSVWVGNRLGAVLAEMRAVLVETRTQLGDVHHQINSRMDDLLAKTETIAHAAGVKEEYDRNAAAKP